MTAPRFFVRPEALLSATAVLTGSELRHLRVRRLRVGSDVVLADGTGQQRHGIVRSIDRHQALVCFTAQEPPARESALQLVLAQAVLKADKLDLVIEKSVELGVTEIVLFISERTVCQAPASRVARCNRIARSAAKQSQRSVVPTVTGPLSLNDIFGRRDGLGLFFWEDSPPGGITAVQRATTSADSILAVVGPEGGFSGDEAGRAARAGFRLVGLAPRILRAETAAIVAATLCQFLWGDLASAQR